MLKKCTRRPRLTNGVPFVGMVLVGCLPPPLKRAYYRWHGASIGKGVELGMFSYIQSPKIELADSVKISPFTFIRARVNCRIGARSRIHAFTAIDTGVFDMGEDSSILEQVAIGGMLTPRSSLVIGSRVKILSYSFINPTEPITIEDEVCVGGGSYIFSHGSWQSMLDGFPGGFGPVTLKRGAWVAWRVFIMPNVTIGEEATIGAGSIVTRDIPARTLAIGSPAKPIKVGSEYIRNVGEGEQHALLLEWLEEFADFLSYIGRDTEFKQNDNGAILRVSVLEGHPDFIIVYKRQAAKTNQEAIVADMLVSLVPISKLEREAFTVKGGGWFDLSTRECGLSPHPLWEELRNFLNRYGVRFAVCSLYSCKLTREKHIS